MRWVSKPLIKAAQETTGEHGGHGGKPFEIDAANVATNDTQELSSVSSVLSVVSVFPLRYLVEAVLLELLMRCWD
jgi:hypothetical protein